MMRCLVCGQPATVMTVERIDFTVTPFRLDKASFEPCGHVWRVDDRG